MASGTNSFTWLTKVNASSFKSEHPTKKASELLESRGLIVYIFFSGESFSAEVKVETYESVLIASRINKFDTKIFDKIVSSFSMYFVMISSLFEEDD